MDVLTLPIPHDAVLVGELLAHYEPEDLDEDICQIRLANGIGLDVGWKAGWFLLVAYRGDFHNQLGHVRRAKTPTAVAAELADMIRTYRGVDG